MGKTRTVMTPAGPRIATRSRYLTLGCEDVSCSACPVLCSQFVMALALAAWRHVPHHF